MSQLRYEHGSKALQTFVHLYEAGQLNLSPGFQRKSVWKLRDRQALIESIYTHRPIPSVFLYRSTDERGRLKYDVIDGKQRLEAVLAFIGAPGFRGQRFDLRLQLEGDKEPKSYDWTSLRRNRLEHVLMSYSVATVEVAGDLSDIIDLFVRINSTGKHLTTAEKRHARFYEAPLLRVASRLARQRQPMFEANKIITAAQFARMKHIELVSELLASLVNGGPINKKAALDAIIGGKGVATKALTSAAADFTRTINRVSKMFPRLAETRLRNSSDFYSLFMYVWQLEKQGAILTDRKRNQQAQELILMLSNGVDSLRDRVRKLEGAKPDERLFQDYLLTVQGDTDSQSTRIRRQRILETVLGGIFEHKDEKRAFTPEQRRILWHSDSDRRCTMCKNSLTWANFTIDHIRPHSRGGKTSLKNASLLCARCNSRKGNRRQSGATGARRRAV